MASVPMTEAHNVYVARTYAYVAAGSHGLVIVDVENPEKPRVDQIFNANGVINDLHDVKLGITYVSEFAYLADGRNGLRVVQLTSPETPGNNGFSPRPTPELIASYRLPHCGKALAISKGLDRDRGGRIGKSDAVFAHRRPAVHPSREAETLSASEPALAGQRRSGFAAVRAARAAIGCSPPQAQVANNSCNDGCLPSLSARPSGVTAA